METGWPGVENIKCSSRLLTAPCAADAVHLTCWGVTPEEKAKHVFCSAAPMLSLLSTLSKSVRWIPSKFHDREIRVLERQSPSPRIPLCRPGQKSSLIVNNGVPERGSQAKKHRSMSLVRCYGYGVAHPTAHPFTLNVALRLPKSRDICHRRNI